MVARDLLKATNRQSGGRNYDRLLQALRRLKGTMIDTDIETGGKRIRTRNGEGFSIIDGRMIAVDVTLSEWTYNAIMANEVLTISRDYFRLDGGLERRLYEIGRKHCGEQPRFTIGLDKLRLKSGAQCSLKEFRRHVREIVEHYATSGERFPDYDLELDAKADVLIFRNQDVHWRSRALAAGREPAVPR